MIRTPPNDEALGTGRPITHEAPPASLHVKYTTPEQRLTGAGADTVSFRPRDQMRLAVVTSPSFVMSKLVVAARSNMVMRRDCASVRERNSASSRA